MDDDSKQPTRMLTARVPQWVFDVLDAQPGTRTQTLIAAVREYRNREARTDKQATE